MSREDIMMWSLVLSIANFILMWGVALYMYLTNKNKATNARIDSLSGDFLKSITDHGNRLVKIESRPTSDALSKAIVDHGERLAKIESRPTSAALSQAVVNHGERLALLESRPTHKDLAELHEKTNGVARDVSELTGVVSGMSRLLSSIDEHLRSKA